MGAAASLGTASAGLTAMIPFVGPFLAPFVGGAVFLSTLYTGGVAAERAREEYIKNVLNLDEEEKKPRVVREQQGTYERVITNKKKYNRKKEKDIPDDR